MLEESAETFKDSAGELDKIIIRYMQQGNLEAAAL